MRVRASVCVCVRVFQGTGTETHAADRYEHGLLGELPLDRRARHPLSAALPHTSPARPRASAISFGND